MGMISVSMNDRKKERDPMQKKIGVVAVMVGFLIVFSVGGAMACSGAGKNRHIGNVTEVNPGAMTLTIRDAETSDLLTFTADKEALAGIKEADRVLIDYKVNDGDLVAVKIQTAS